MTPSERDGAPAAGQASHAFSGDSAGVGKRVVQAVYYAFVLWIPLETMNAMKNGDSGFTFSKMLGLLLFGLAIVNRRLCFRRATLAFWLVAWYLAACALSQLWVPGNLDARFRDNQITLIQMAALFLISTNLFEDADFRASLLRFYGWWISVVGVGMMLGVVGGVFAGTGGRISILGQDPNVAAGFFALGGICIAGDSRMFASRWFIVRILLSLLAVSALLMAILQTGSRGGLIVFVAGILGLVLCGGKATRMKRLLIAGAVIGALGVMIVREFQQGTDTATRLIDSWDKGDTAGRTQIYDVAWEMVRERPLPGYGATNNYSRLGVLLNYSAGDIFFRDTHNLLLAVLTEVGIIGAAPFLAAIFYALWQAWRYGRKTDDGLPFALMCAQLVINTSLTGYHQKLLWIVFAAAVASGLELDDARKPRSIHSMLPGAGAVAA